MIIGKEILETATRLTGSLLLKHKDEIDKAYLKAENSLKVDIPITFVTDRVKDEISGQMKEGQMELFKDNKKNTTNAYDPEEQQKAIGTAKPELAAGKVIDIKASEG